VPQSTNGCTLYLNTLCVIAHMDSSRSNSTVYYIYRTIYTSMYGSYRPYRAPPPAQYGNLHLNVANYDAPDLSELFGAVHTYNATWLWVDIETSGLNPAAPDFGILEIAAVVTSQDLTVQDTFHVIVHQPPAVIANASKWCANHFGSSFAGGNDLFDQCRASAISEKQAGELLRDFIVRHSAARRRPPQVRNDPRRQLFSAVEFGDLSSQCVAAGLDDQATAAQPVNIPPPVSDAERDAVMAKPALNTNPQQDVYRVFLAGCSCYFDRHVLLTRFPYLQKHIGHKVIDTTSLLEVARRFRPDMLGSLRAATCSHRALQDIHESLNILRWFWTNFMVNYGR
jgi:oligoribonuclease (3'-5' exoribonuclease)